MPPSPASISSPLTLPHSGRKLRNRFSKSATTECLANPLDHLPTPQHSTLYETWGASGCGMIVTGNVMVNGIHLESPRNLALYADTRVDDKDSCSPARLDAFKKLSAAIHKHDKTTLAIMQINHPGRQSPVAVTGARGSPIAPSAVPLKLPKLGALTPLIFHPPTAMTNVSILATITSFVSTAQLAEQAGFDGVQIHAAHGYLISQFLSPSANLRSTFYGGTRAARRRFLTEVVTKIRDKVKKSFVVSIKLNSSDFLADGFDEDACVDLIAELSKLKALDFIEISGGTYGNAEMMLDPASSRRRGSGAKSAFFQSFCDRLAKAETTELPIMCTGGFRTRTQITAALESSLQIIGLARPLCVQPTFPRDFLAGTVDQVDDYTLKIPGPLAPLLEPALNNFWHQRQIHKLAKGGQPELSLGYVYSLTVQLLLAYVFDPAMHPQISKGLVYALVGVVVLFVPRDAVFFLGGLVIAARATSKYR